ncbi:MAG: carboxypeptidase-like regulatory domain-containing protein, partial [Chloroflexota bacterium]|nr:carboxypeptidase-like regulatory domain-containing protein [Chloroflexota bacterium]
MRAMKPFMLLFVLVVWACTPAGTPVPLGETDAPTGASTLTPVLETDPPIAMGTSTARRETAEPMLSGIWGTVRGSGSDLPAAGVFVQARDHAGVTVTAISDSTGEFRIADLPPGSYRVSAHGTGFQQATFVEVTLSGEEDARLDWTLSPVEDIHPQ